MTSQLHQLLDVATGGAWSQTVGGPPGPWPHRPVVYGPGRGLFLSAKAAQAAMDEGKVAEVELGDAPGVWVVTCGPGALGRSADLRSGQDRPTLHCSSWTNLLLGVLLAADPALWHHGGNMPSLEELCETSGRWRYAVPGGSTISVLGYRDHCRRVRPRTGRTLTPLELWERRGELGPVTVSAQSSRLANGSWRWEHHTVAWLRNPLHPGVLYRVAADGSRGTGGYSGTPMDIEVLDHAKAIELTGRQLHRAWTVPALPAVPRCPITLETPR